MLVELFVVFAKKYLGLWLILLKTICEFSRSAIFTNIHNRHLFCILNIFSVLIFYTFVLICTGGYTTHNMYKKVQNCSILHYMYTVKNYYKEVSYIFEIILL
jgi:hypothetical protein